MSAAAKFLFSRWEKQTAPYFSIIAKTLGQDTALERLDVLSGILKLDYHNATNILIHDYFSKFYDADLEDIIINFIDRKPDSIETGMLAMLTSILLHFPDRQDIGIIMGFNALLEGYALSKMKKAEFLTVYGSSKKPTKTQVQSLRSMTGDDLELLIPAQMTCVEIPAGVDPHGPTLVFFHRFDRMKTLEPEMRMGSFTIVTRTAGSVRVLSYPYAIGLDTGFLTLHTPGIDQSIQEGSIKTKERDRLEEIVAYACHTLKSLYQ